MSATNVIKNPKTTTVDGTTVTGILEVTWDDATGYLRDGSDNDTTYTFTARQANQCRGTIRGRDPAQLELIKNKTNVTIVFVGAAAAGSDKTFTISNASTGQVGGRNPWDTLGEYSLSIEGGGVVIT